MSKTKREMKRIVQNKAECFFGGKISNCIFTDQYYNYIVEITLQASIRVDWFQAASDLLPMCLILPAF